MTERIFLTVLTSPPFLPSPLTLPSPSTNSAALEHMRNVFGEQTAFLGSL